MSGKHAWIEAWRDLEEAREAFRAATMKLHKAERKGRRKEYEAALAEHDQLLDKMHALSLIERNLRRILSIREVPKPRSRKPDA